MLLDKFTYHIQYHRIEALAGTKKPLQDIIKELHDTYTEGYGAIDVDTPEATSIFYYCILHSLAVNLCSARSPASIKIHNRFIYCLALAYKGATPELYHKLFEINPEYVTTWRPKVIPDLVKINKIVEQINVDIDKLTVDCYTLNSLSSYLIKEYSTVSKTVYNNYAKHVLGPDAPVIKYIPLPRVAPAPTDINTDLPVLFDILNILTKIKEPNNE